MRTADLYVRVSTDEQAEKGYSLRSQKMSLPDIVNSIISK
jgi:DNA invertase Pin-like site-specific DNA recombinase